MRACRFSLLSALALVWGAAPSAASPVTVFFNGPSGTGFSQSTFDAIKGDFLVASPSLSGQTTGITTAYQSGSMVPNPPTGDHTTYTEDWTVQNQPSFEYLLFVTTVDYDVDGTPVSFADANVGLSIDPDLGWVIVTIPDGGQDYYYAAFPFGAGATAAFEVNIVVDEPIPLVGGTYYFPRLGVAVAVPEPATAALLTSALIGLALNGRRRRA